MVMNDESLRIGNPSDTVLLKNSRMNTFSNQVLVCYFSTHVHTMCVSMLKQLLQ